VVLAFGVFVVYSRHLRIALAPLNVMFSRRPNALGLLEPMRSNGKQAQEMHRPSDLRVAIPVYGLA
jgi:hypothetical protein